MRSLRTALICLLMLTLPAQSMAALSMQVCAVIQQGGPMAQVDPQVTAHHPGVMGMAASAEASTHGEHHARDNASQSLTATDNSLCSLCAFCVGAVALSTAAASNTPLQTVEPSLARLDQFIGFISEPLERPPRLFLV
ncbi:hypothetical protein DBR00_13000 [Pseudomonas sp. HMWF032]|uniref:hypothetical protein n=1 Tax=unclassified Pseudomonas TaxID=196821 RepID=UPI000D3A550C|nr:MULTISPECIES: hypothetical protein [unclassified Pseudomonas]PTS83432.1 hypothetical protein DBR00_13000 [Pseudomonas sp. HMWF032]PTT85648.1 hypothetical protein DBR41_03125 [Pseudomonas sp. HMWF010]WAC44662.1 hypothetical protein OU997_00200 [Pseudomonas sp. SL4(2022)]